MDKQKVLVAIASSDGIVVNSHFGKTDKFYIYEVCEDNISFIEIREVEHVCNGGNHDELRFHDSDDNNGSSDADRLRHTEPVDARNQKEVSG